MQNNQCTRDREVIERNKQIRVCGDCRYKCADAVEKCWSIRVTGEVKKCKRNEKVYDSLLMGDSIDSGLTFTLRSGQ
jgi:hypothetical protein